MDPLVASCADVFDLIFQHFNAKDVIRSSLVSKSFYEIVGSSHFCMKQLWLEIENPSKQLTTLERSQRKYENLRIYPDARSELSSVLKKFRPKVVRVSDDQGDPIKHDFYFELMHSMAPTLVDLHLGETESVQSRRLRSIDFPQLKELHCTAVNRNAFSVFLGSNPQLENVSLAFNTGISIEFLVPTNIVHEFLQRNSQIKRLIMSEIDCAFQSDLTENVALDLESFAFSKTSGKFSERVVDNLVQFIEAQSNLQSLKVRCLYDQELLTRIWSLRFKRLFIMDLNPKGSPAIQNLSPNDFVEEIDFYLNSSCHILKFLQASPNLTSFKLRQLSRHIMRFSALNLRNLKRIQFQSLENGVESHYEDLKNLDGDDVNRGIKLEEIDFFDFVGVDIGF